MTLNLTKFIKRFNITNTTTNTMTNNTQVTNSISCYSCYSCKYCTSGYYCDFCNSCNTCGFCDSCNSCDVCDSCNSCNYCLNLEVTEHNIFCYAEEKGDKNSFQQARYRIFNTQITKEEYENIEVPKITLDFDKNESYITRYQTAFKKAWEKLSKDEKDKFLNLPYFDADIFEKITGVNTKLMMNLNQYLKT
jgi:hypothetical protein